MIILHVSDVHCATGMLRRVLGSVSFDMVAATGDYECMDTAEALLSAPAPVAAVTGNMDNPAIYRRLSEAGVLLDGSSRVIMGVRLAGVGGLDPAGSMQRLSGLDGSDILLSHHPPRGVLDLSILGVHIGLDELVGLASRLGARVHLFGHVHESPGFRVEGGRLHVNPGPLLHGRYALVDYRRGVATLGRVRV